MAREAGLLRLDTVSLAGTEIDASGSRMRPLRYDRAQDLGAKLQADIRALLARAEARRSWPSWTRPARGWKPRRPPRLHGSGSMPTAARTGTAGRLPRRTCAHRPSGRPT